MNEQSTPRKLARSRSDRYIGGVAAGLASYLKVDPVFVRIAFLASLVLGGIGLIAYVLLLAVMPVEGDPSEPLPPVEPNRRNMMIGLAVLVGVVGLITAGSGNFAGWLFGFWPGTVFGILLWSAAAIAAIWLLATGALTRNREPSGNDRPAGSAFPPSEPKVSPDPDAEPVTYAESPTQLPRTEVMETRPMPEQKPGTPEDGPSTIGKIMVWFAIGLTALIVFCILFVFSAATTALAGGIPMAALVIILGGCMVFAGVQGRKQMSLWLLAAAVAITLPMAIISIADLRIEGDYGDINETPLTAAEIPDDGYSLAAGNMTIDLRRFEFPKLKEQTLEVSSGMGLTSVIVPDDVCVTGTVDGKAGVVNIRGRQSSGFSVSQSASGPVNGKPLTRVKAPRLRIDGDFKLGAFEVVDNTQWRADGQAGSFDDNDLEPDDRTEMAARKRATAACAISGSRVGGGQGMNGRAADKALMKAGN